MLSNNDKYNLRCKYNSVGIKYTSARRKTRLRGYDINDKAREYYTSVQIANTYKRTEYVRVNGNIIKLHSYIAQLRHARAQWYIDISRKYITTNVNGIIKTYTITNTNGCIVKNNTLDRKQYNRLYK